MAKFLCAHTCQAYIVCPNSLLFTYSFFHKPTALIACWKNVTQMLLFFFFFFGGAPKRSSEAEALHGEMQTVLTLDWKRGRCRERKTTWLIQKTRTDQREQMVSVASQTSGTEHTDENQKLTQWIFKTFLIVLASVQSNFYQMFADIRGL